MLTSIYGAPGVTKNSSGSQLMSKLTCIYIYTYLYFCEASLTFFISYFSYLSLSYTSYFLLSTIFFCHSMQRLTWGRSWAQTFVQVTLWVKCLCSLPFFFIFYIYTFSNISYSISYSIHFVCLSCLVFLDIFYYSFLHLFLLLYINLSYFHYVYWFIFYILFYTLYIF